MKYTVVGQQTIDELPTRHRLIQGDARDLSFIPDESIHLIITSPPYWTLKVYNDSEGQMGHIKEYDDFLAELNRVWAEAYRVLVPGGRVVCVVGDVCLSRRENNGRHTVVPLHADICVQCRRLGFDNLNPIIWHKISNASYEVNNGSKFLGKPYEPNAIIKNDIEFILMQRKPGGYRQRIARPKPTPRRFPWNSPRVSSRCFRSPAIPSWIPSAARPQRWWPRSSTGATASAWNLTPNTANWPPRASSTKTPPCSGTGSFKSS